MKRTGKIFMLLPCVIFMAWYIVVSYVNVYACDDYWHGTNVHTYGFLGAQKYYWNNWEGSYIHTLLATLPHVINYDKTPFICNQISLVILFCSLFAFLKSFFRLDKTNNLVISFYLVAFLYTFTSGDSEIRFWVCANNAYIFGISTTLLFLVVYHIFDFKSSQKAIGLIIFLLLIVGNKVSYIYFVFLCIVFHDAIFKKVTNKRLLAMIITITILSLLNVLAPGNYIRLEENMKESIETGMSFINAMTYRLQELLPFCLYSLLLFPICSIIRIPVEKKTLFYGLAALLLIFFGDTIIMYICFHDCGPRRGNVILEASIIIFMCMLFCFITERIKAKHVLYLLHYVSVLSFVYFGFIQTEKIGQSISFSNAAKQRNEIVKSTKNDSIIRLYPLPESGLLLPYFCNEVIWIENVYLPYFGKKARIEIIDDYAD